MQEDSQTRELRVGGWLPTQRMEPEQPVPGWAANDETMLLPAFLTGAPDSTRSDDDDGESAGAHAAPTSGAPSGGAPSGDGPEKTAKASDIEGRLPASERNMLIFVASLLALGTLAVITMMTLSTHKHPKGHPTGVTPSSSTRTGATPSLAGHVFVGRPDPGGYCGSVTHNATPSPPGAASAKWTCAHPGKKPVAFTPADVCHAQFGAKTIATYDRLNDPTTWRCYR